MICNSTRTGGRTTPLNDINPQEGGASYLTVLDILVPDVEQNRGKPVERRLEMHRTMVRDAGGRTAAELRTAATRN